jgi:O-antigen/teichoic acid export membrane protein
MINKIKTFYSSNLGDFKYYFVSKFFVGLSWLILLKIISNNITTTAFSDYSLLLIFATFFSSINSLWISSSYIRFYHSNLNKNLYSISIKLLVISTFFFLILFSTTYWTLAIHNILPYKLNTFLSLSCYFLTNSVFLFFLGKYSGELKVKKSLLFNSLNLTFLITLIFYFKKTLSIDLIFNIYFLVSLTIIGLMYFFEKEELKNIKIDKQILSEIYKYGFPIILINIFVILHSSVDQFLLKYYNHQKDLGIYAANYAIADKSLLIFTNIYVSSFTPRLFQSYSLNIKETFLAYKKIILFYIVMIIPITLIVVLFYKDIFGLVLSSEFLNPKIGNLILFGAMFNGASQILSEYFTLKKSTLLLAAIYFIPVVINFALNYFLIPIYKIDSAVYSTIFTYFILFSLLLVGVYFTSRKNV